MPRRIDVILPLAIASAYTYRVPAGMRLPEVGERVIVPLGKKQVVGIVIRHLSETERLTISEDKLRDALALPDEVPILIPSQMSLWKWMSDYYLCPLGDVMAAALPAKALDKQFTLAGSLRKVRLPSFAVTEPLPLNPLNEQQQKALLQIQSAWQSHSVTLLQGVTSSGKTEVYIHLIRQCLEAGQQVLFLVPEIALTTQLTDRLSLFFGSELLVYHSRITDAQRMEIYRRLLMDDTQPRLIIGARSAVFLPLRQVRLIIIDEEHEPSYKQQDPQPRYSARSAAIRLAQMVGAKVLLGTATPSIETRYAAEKGKVGLATMTQRFQSLRMPKITLVDLQRQYHRKEMYEHFSDPLVLRIQQELQKEKQVILFQNRRGFAPYMQCKQCGGVPKCPACDVALTLHHSQNAYSLRCHYCGAELPLISSCQKCGGTLQTHGFGTERIEDEVERLFPAARMARLDLDSTRRKDAYSTIISDFASHKIDILIGTQMVTKGLHFDNVSLVAVLNADSLFNTPSFRSYERAFQMLEQVAGRAGRTGAQGEVIIQTFDPKHPIFHYLIHHDVDGFYEWQIKEREAFVYPPFSRIVLVSLKGKQESTTEEAGGVLQQMLFAVFGQRCSELVVPSIARVQNWYIRQIRLKIETTASLAEARRRIIEQLETFRSIPAYRSISVQIDVDPM